MVLVTPHTAPDNLSLTVDTTPPTDPVFDSSSLFVVVGGTNYLNKAALADTQPKDTITATSSDTATTSGGTVEYVVAGGDNITCDSGSGTGLGTYGTYHTDTPNTATGYNAFGNRFYTICARAIDAVGNISGYKSQPFEVDKVAPNAPVFDLTSANTALVLGHDNSTYFLNKDGFDTAEDLVVASSTSTGTTIAYNLSTTSSPCDTSSLAYNRTSAVQANDTDVIVVGNGDPIYVCARATDDVGNASYSTLQTITVDIVSPDIINSINIEEFLVPVTTSAAPNTIAYYLNGRNADRGIPVDIAKAVDQSSSNPTTFNFNYYLPSSSTDTCVSTNAHEYSPTPPQTDDAPFDINDPTNNDKPHRICFSAEDNARNTSYATLRDFSTAFTTPTFSIIRNVNTTGDQFTINSSDKAESFGSEPLKIQVHTSTVESAGGTCSTTASNYFKSGFDSFPQTTTALSGTGTGTTDTRYLVCFRLENIYKNITIMSSTDSVTLLQDFRVNSSTTNTAAAGDVDGTSIGSINVYTNDTELAFVGTAPEGTIVNLYFQKDPTDPTVPPADSADPDYTGTAIADKSIAFVGSGTHPEGIYYIYARARENASAADLSDFFSVAKLEVDITKPTIVINVISDDDYVNSDEKANSLTVSGTTNAEAGETVSVTLDNGTPVTVAVEAATPDNTWTVTFPIAEQPDTDGTANVVANVFDRAGNEAIDATREIIYDTTAPTIIIIDTQNGTYQVVSADSVDTDWDVVDRTLSEIAATCESNHANDPAAYDQTGTNLTGGGTQQICVRVVDTAGNFAFETTLNALDGLANAKLSNTDGSVVSGIIYTNDNTPTIVATTTTVYSF